jgi:hypothetical protein
MRGRRPAPPGASLLAVATAVALAAVLGTIGADARWLAVLGSAIADSRSIPDGVPYAAAPSDGWPNVVVLAELIFHGLEAAFGDRGLLLAQLAAVATGFWVLARDARRSGASDAATAFVLLLVAVGAVAELVVVRVQLFSLALFPLLLALLRDETRSPSRRIWLVVPLVALWSNLHGAVLVGVAVAGAYLLVERLRRQPLTAVAVLASTIVALSATPALARTPEYYVGVLENEAARRGYGLWERLSFTSGFDVVLVLSAIVLLVLALRARPAAWELVAFAGLAVLTIRTGRSGVWLLIAAAVPAARGVDVSHRIRAPTAIAALTVLLALSAFGLARGPIQTGAGGAIVRDALSRARGTPIAAEPLLAEQLVLAGGRVWMANPLDAFPRRDQGAYIDWLEGRPGGDSVLANAPRVAVVRPGHPADERLRRDPRWRRAREDSGAVLYVARP